MQQYNDNIFLYAPKSVDDKYAIYQPGGTIPYDSVASVNARINLAYRHIGLTVLIDDGSVVAEYWYKDGIDDSDLILKTPPFAQIQTDWDQTDDTQVDYLKNKPAFPDPQNWQETLIVGSTLTQNNTIAGGGFDFFWNSMRHFINKTAEAGTTDGRLNIGVAANGGVDDKALRVKSTRNTAYLEIVDTTQPGNGGLDAINITSVNKDGNKLFWLSGRWLQLWGDASPITISNGVVQVAASQVYGDPYINITSSYIESGFTDLIFKHSDVSPLTEVARISSTGQFRVGLNSIEACAKLQVDSTTQGVLLPRMTKTQRDAITTPIAGLAIYQTDNTPGLRIYNGSNWMKYTETAD